MKDLDGIGTIERLTIDIWASRKQPLGRKGQSKPIGSIYDAGTHLDHLCCQHQGGAPVAKGIS